MSKVLRVHNSTIDVQGIGTSPSCVKISDFAGVIDPLSVGSNNSINSLAEKPASSIPSIFARMIFFRMAFGGIDVSNYVLQPGDPVSVYNRAISQCFDLLEIVFNNQTGLEVKCFDFNQQIQALNNDGISEHQRFAISLKEQKDKFLTNMDCIYLFYLNNKIMGGTSKYSLVFTSPNWSSNRPVKSLLEREEEFRLFVYKYVKAHVSAGMGRQNNEEYEFYQYVDNCINAERVANPTVFAKIPTHFTIIDLVNEYPILNKPINGIDTNILINTYNGTPIHLYSRPKNQFTSDFFIKSTVQQTIDRDHTPLVLSEGQHYGMKYYDQVNWDSATRVPQVEHDPSTPDAKNDLPDCNAYNHPYLTEIDFLEENLLALPFNINESGFYGGIKLNDELCALIPVKPVYFQYFKPDDLANQMKWDPSTKIFTLTIPVCNLQGIEKGKIEFRKNYSASICYLADSGAMKQTSLSFGVFPLLRSSDPDFNDYWIMFGMDAQSQYNDVILHYYNNGNEKELLYDELKRRGADYKSWYQHVKEFDFVRIELPKADEEHEQVRAIVVPKFNDHKVKDEGTKQCNYAIDFGTTNTHVAYRIDGDDPNSFSEENIKQQVVYLNGLKSTTGELDIVQAKEYIPHFDGRNYKYKFPTRTVVNTNGNVTGTEGDSVLFAKTSIGFHYSNEFVKSQRYDTNLKWKYLTTANGVNERNVESFFEEIMRMIRTHWLLQSTNHSVQTYYPKIVLTYPLAGVRGLNKTITGWENAYERVFGVDPMANPANPLILKMVESLAPCVRMITTKNATKAGGVLNIDIGGGTTDIQFYKESLEGTWSYYDSIKFAGDDLWGIGNENVSEYLSRPIGVTNNHFTNLAGNKLGNATIRLGNDTLSYSQINFDDCKEKVNCLLRDNSSNFTNVLSDFADPDTHTCRLHMFLHYSAIIFHVSKWMKAYNMPIPQTLSFSGLGSLYVKVLFNKIADLTSFSKSLIEKYYGAVAPSTFNVVFEGQPKNVTAEGAVLSIGAGIANPIERHHFGYCTNVQVLSKDIKTVKGDTMDYFNAYIEGFEACASMVGGNVIPSIDGVEKTNLTTWADLSFDNIATAHRNLHAGNPQDKLDESAFIWTLKDSLWKL